MEGRAAAARLAWYGNFVGGRGSFVSPALLRLLYPAYGDEGDHESLDLSPTAHQIAEALRPGPLPSATLRGLVGDRNRYQRAAAELQRALLTTNAGTEEQAAGWPSAVIDLTCRRFDVGGAQDLAEAAAVFVDTVLSCYAGRAGPRLPLAGRRGPPPPRRPRRRRPHCPREARPTTPSPSIVDPRLPALITRPSR